MDNYIKNNNIILKIVCEEKIILKLKQELNDYYEFVIGKFQPNLTFYVYTDRIKYKKVSSTFVYKNNNHHIKFIKDRNGIILLNKEKKEIIAFYNDITNNVIQFIEEIIISIFGMFLTEQKYFFMHAACVEKEGKSIAIIGDRSSGKTTILNILMQNRYNFVCNSHLGMRDIKDEIQVIGSPSRLGMRVETIEKSMKSDVKQKIFLNTEFRERFGRKAENNLKLYRTKKFNIKLNEIKEIYNVDLVSTSTLKLIIVPIYIEQLEHIKIKKMEEKLKKNEILLKNKREGMYDTTKYMDILEINQKNVLPKNLSNINMYKVYQNERCIDELVKFLQLESK